MTAQRCGTCVHLAARTGANGQRVITPRHLYICRAPLPALPKMPDSVTLTVTRQRMLATDGATCPAWRDRRKG